MTAATASAMDGLITLAESRWRAWREAHPFPTTGNLEGPDLDRMREITDALLPPKGDRAALLALVIDDRVWTTDSAYGEHIGEALREGIRDVLERAMWALDGVN